MRRQLNLFTLNDSKPEVGLSLERTGSYGGLHVPTWFKSNFTFPRI